MSAEQCRAEADAVRALFDGVDLSPQMFEIDGVTLAVRTDLPPQPVRHGPVLSITPSEIRYKGRDLPLEQLRAELSSARQRLQDDIDQGRVPRHDPPDPTLIHVHVDRGAPWSLVVEAVAVAADAGMTSPAFAFAAPQPPRRQPAGPIVRELAALRASESTSKATDLAKLTSREIASCPSMQRAMGHVASDDTEDRAGDLVRRVPQAMIDCNCKLHVENLKTILWWLLVNEKPVRVLHTRTGTRAGDDPPKRIEHSVTTTWEIASQQLDASTAHVTFAVSRR